jgi:CRP-like cAMP-binding protein
LVLGGTAGVYVPKSQEQLEQESNDFPRRSVAFVAFDEKAYRSKFKRKEKTQVDDEVALLNAGRVDRYFNEAGLCLFKKVHVYNTFEAFGDMALTTDKPRTASIVALTDLHLLSLTKLEFRVHLL